MQSRLGTTIGAVAQVVEQWTENPCVAGSTPASTTLGPLFFSGLFCFHFWDTALLLTKNVNHIVICASPAFVVFAKDAFFDKVFNIV